MHLAPICRPSLSITDRVASQAAEVLEAPAEVEEYSNDKRRREHVVMSRQLATRLGLDRREHVIVEVSPSQRKLMTFEVDYGLEVDAVYLHQFGLDEIAGDPGILTFPQSATILTELPFESNSASAEANDTLYERSLSSGTQVFVNAIHGGDIELNTENQAQIIYNLLAGNRYGSYLYSLEGYSSGTQSGNDRWHITAVDFQAKTFQGLPEGRDFDIGIGLHGYVATGGQADILIGGTAPQAERDALKVELDTFLAGTGVTTDSTDIGDHLDGDADDNVTNRYVSSGRTFQLEQVFTVRNDPLISQLVAQGVASYIIGLLPTPPAVTGTQDGVLSEALSEPLSEVLFVALV